ncbi:MAG: hypothetical protein JSS66_16905 [Armatimonadetes bacterium]|nr:hypothetical protein [Armatimonadota bacterium]
MSMFFALSLLLAGPQSPCVLEKDGLEEEGTLREQYEVLAYPNERPNYGTIRTAFKMKAAMALATGGGDQFPALGPWEYLGPTNLQTYQGPYGYGPPPINGRINVAVFDPFDPNKMYAASGRGGLWKTVDNGVNWTPLSDNWLHASCSSVLASPVFPNHVYVGTGDEPGNGAYNYGAGIGVMVTKDGGLTWAQRGVVQFDDVLVSDIVTDPQDPSRLFVASGGGNSYYNKLYMSPDEGQTWQLAINTFAYWYDLDAASASQFPYVWVTGRLTDQTLVLRVSTNHGASWTNVPLPLRGLSSDRVFVAASKVDPSKPYIYYTDSQKVYKGGAFLGAWIDITGNLKTVAGGNWAQSFFNNGLTCFLNNFGGAHDSLVVQNVDSYIAKDVSGTWASVAGSYSHADLSHVDHHNLGPHPSDPNQFLLSTDGGVLRTIYNPVTNTFAMTQLSKNLGCCLVTRISVDKDVNTGIIAGLQDNGYAVCGTDISKWDNILLGDCGHSARNQVVPGIQYIVPPNFDKDDNGDGYVLATGNAWADRRELPLNTLGEKHRSSPPLVIEPVNNRYLYTATNYLHRYDPVSDTWSVRLGGQILSTDKHVRHLAVAPSDANRIYTVSQDGEVWMTQNGGSSWAPIQKGSPGLPAESIGRVSIDPANPSRILVAFEGTGLFGKLWECKDTLANPRVWEDKTGNIVGKQLPVAPATSIARLPNSPTTVWFVGNEAGVYMTRDGGATWDDFTPTGQFPGVAVTDMVAHTATRTLVVSTYGRGIWRRRIDKIPLPRPQTGG